MDETAITSHVSAATVSAVEFPEGADWVNSQPLAIHGKRTCHLLAVFYS